MKGTSYLRYRRLAPWYDAGVKLLALPFGGEAALRGKVLGLLPLNPGDNVLEVGCGTGTVMLMAADLVGPGGEVVGIDPSAEMIARARRKIAKSNLSQGAVLQGAGAPLPFSDCSFNSVIFFLVLHEMVQEDRIDSLHEALRVLKPGGHLLVGDFSRPESPVGRLLQQLMLLPEEEEAADFLRRGLQTIIREGSAGALTEVKRERLVLGLLQGVLYVKNAKKEPGCSSR
ncbi:MAG: hypothetical protein A2X80_01155 [Geobacteraceae bacterium GWB2_52_12]|nr:MAG: hypothetical protein A2X80_01155 [Geobacteraceae bacterium GWB2_52_12]